MDVAVERTIKVHHRRAGFIVIEEMQLVISFGQMRYQLAMQGIVSGFHRAVSLGYLLLRTQAVVIVGKLHRHTRFAHLLELAALLPSIRPRAIVQRVANGIIGNRLPIVRRQFVLPVAARIGTGNKKDGTRVRAIPGRGFTSTFVLCEGARGWGKQAKIL